MRTPQRLLNPITRIGSAVIGITVVAAMLGLSRPQPAGNPPPVDISALPGPSAMPTTAQTAIGPLGPVVSTPDGVQWAFAFDGGTMSGSAGAMTQRHTTESMIKPWLAADYLRLHPKPGQERLDQIRRAIRDSSDRDAQALYTALGSDATITRMIDVCVLPGTTLTHDWWSLTAITAADTLRLGRCLSNGTAAGPQWTPWLLDEMRHIQGEGAFGIRDGIPASAATALAYKNGYTLHHDTNTWAVNCLAIGTGWTLTVLQRYPDKTAGKTLGLDHGAQTCAWIAAQLAAFIITPPAGA